MPNSLAAVTPQILSMVLGVLRENCVMPALVNNDYGDDARNFGSTVDIPVTSAMSATDVVPGPVLSDTGVNDLTPSSVQLQLNQWKEVKFRLSDKELHEIMEGYLTPEGQLAEAVRTLANTIDGSILEQYKFIYNSVGAAGTTPFSTSTVEAQDAYRVLNVAKASPQQRRIVLDPFADANAIGLPALQAVNRAGTDVTLRDATIPRTLGFDWYLDQNVKTHTPGVTPAEIYAVDNASGYLAANNVTSILIDGGDDAIPTTPPAVGDRFTFAGSTQQYVVTAITTGATEHTITISPKLQADVANNVVLTFVSTPYTANLAFSRRAIGFASRPLADVNPGGNIIETVSDPISGLTFRLELMRGNKQTYWSLDALWGVKVVDPSVATLILG